MSFLAHSCYLNNFLWKGVGRGEVCYFDDLDIYLVDKIPIKDYWCLLTIDHNLDEIQIENRVNANDTNNHNRNHTTRIVVHYERRVKVTKNNYNRHHKVSTNTGENKRPHKD